MLFELLLNENAYFRNVIILLCIIYVKQNYIYFILITVFI